MCQCRILIGAQRLSESPPRLIHDGIDTDTRFDFLLPTWVTFWHFEVWLNCLKTFSDGGMLKEMSDFFCHPSLVQILNYWHSSCLYNCKCWRVLCLQAGQPNPMVKLFVVNLYGPTHTLELTPPDELKLRYGVSVFASALETQTMIWRSLCL